MPDPAVDPEPVPVEPVPVEAIPVEPVPAELLPAEPVPVELLPDDVPPAATPLPAWPAYTPPALRGPPGGVVTLGVCSIIVAAVCLIGGGVTTVGQWGSYVVSVVTAGRTNAQATQQQQSATATVTGPAEVVGVGGMAAADRAIVITALARAQPLTPLQRGHLDELLATDGQAAVPTGGPPTIEVVTAMLTGSGRIPSLGTATVAPTYFNTTAGRLVVGDDQAVFYPADGQRPITATAYVIPPASADAAPPPLSDEQLRSILRSIAAKAGGRPTAAQVTGLVDLLRMPTQQVIVPTGTGVDPAVEVTGVSTEADLLTIETQHGTATYTLTVQPDGRVSAQAGTANAAPVVTPKPRALSGVLWTAVAQAAVAVYLLVIGILTVRQHRRGGRLHWAYVAVKVPIAIGAIVAAQALWPSLFAGQGGASMPISPWAWPAVIGLVYPVAVAALLAMPSVRAYYRAVS